METLYTLENIRAEYGGRPVLDIAELSLRRGGLYALVGPNGAGKSTLLDILSFIRPPDGGRILFGGEEVLRGSSSLSDFRRRATLVHQKPYLMNRTVYENIAFGLRVRGVHAKKQKEAVLRALDSVGLYGFEQRNARALSGGETQRVAIARAIALEAEVILFDEPTSSLCHEATALFEVITERLRLDGKTIILSSHDPKQPHRLNAEVIRLQNGRLFDPTFPNAHVCRPLSLKFPEATTAEAFAANRR